MSLKDVIESLESASLSQNDLTSTMVLTATDALMASHENGNISGEGALFYRKKNRQSCNNRQN